MEIKRGRCLHFIVELIASLIIYEKSLQFLDAIKKLCIWWGSLRRTISDGADIRRYPISDHIRLYLGYPNPTFYSQIHIRTYPNPTFSDFWANFMQIFGYPNELFDFFGYPNPTFLLFRLSDPIRIRHFTIRIYSYPTFLVSAPSLIHRSRPKK